MDVLGRQVGKISEDLGNGRTRATYKLEVDPGSVGRIVRGPIEAAVRALLVNGRPKELAAEVAKRA